MQMKLLMLAPGIALPEGRDPVMEAVENEVAMALLRRSKDELEFWVGASRVVGEQRALASETGRWN